MFNLKNKLVPTPPYEINLNVKEIESSSPLGEGNSYAFTLAEVLITLVIIGIVAAITIPAMMKNKTNEELNVGLKKNYSLFKQVMNQYYIDNGQRLLSTDIQDSAEGSKKFKTAMKKHVKSIQDCGYGYANYDNFHHTVACLSNSGFSNIYKTYSGKDIRHYCFDQGQFILGDGTIVFLNFDGDGVFVSVDVNGYHKKPNRFGKDLFLFQINEQGELLPGGANGTRFYGNNYCSETSADYMNGAGCTAKALSDPNYFKNLH